MNIVTWQLIPNQYQIDIILVYTKQSYYDTITLLNNKFQFGLEEGIDFDKNDSISPCMVSNDQELKIAIILTEYTKSQHDIAIISHELYHAMTKISQITSATMDMHTTQHWAYFMSFYMLQILQSLNEHFYPNKKSRKNTRKK